MKKGLLMLAMGIASVGLLTGCGSSNTVNLTDYATVNFEGIDGQGTATINYDLTQLEKDFVGDDDNNIYQEEAQKLMEFGQFEVTMKWNLDKEDTLSNGDKVIVTITYNEDLAKSKKIKIKGDTSKEFEVTGLKEAISLDAFDSAVFNTDNGIKISYEGASPYANISIENKCRDEQAQRFVIYTPDKTSNISNGDTITITTSLNKNAIDEGYVLKETQTQITVDGLESYVSKLSELKTEDRKDIEMKLNNLFKDKASDSLRFLVEDQDISLLPDSDYSYGDIEFLDEKSKICENEALLIPFTVDIKDAKFSWWKNLYYEQPLTKTFNDVYGYFVVRNLRATISGEVSDEEIMLDMGSLYDNMDDMDKEIKGFYNFE